MHRNQQIDRNTRLRDCRERPLNVHVALPLHARLDALLERLDDELGLTVYRRDLVGALLLAAPDDPQKLDEMVRRWRIATAAEALIAGVEPGFILSSRSPGPGRRPRRRRC